MGAIKVLLIDSDISAFKALENKLKQQKIDLYYAGDLQTALYRFEKQYFNVVITDANFPELDGLAIIQKFQSHDSLDKRNFWSLLTISKAITKEQKLLLEELGGISRIQKPFNQASFASMVQKAHNSQIRRSLAQKVRTSILNQYKKTGDISEALEETSQSKDTLGSEYSHLLIELLEKISEEKALKYIETLPEGAMSPIKQLSLKGDLYLKCGYLEQAREAYEKANEFAPQNLERLKSLVDVYLESKLPEEARKTQQKLIDLSPENPDLKFDFFNQLCEHGYEDIASQFCQEISTPLEVVKFYNNMGVINIKSGDVDTSLEEYNRALSLYPKNPKNYMIHYNIALAHLKNKSAKNRIQTAKEHLEMALSINPKYDKATDLLTRIGGKSTAA